MNYDAMLSNSANLRTINETDKVQSLRPVRFTEAAELPGDIHALPAALRVGIPFDRVEGRAVYLCHDTDVPLPSDAKPPDGEGARCRELAHLKERGAAEVGEGRRRARGEELVEGGR